MKTLEGIAAVSRELKLRCQEDMSRQKEGEKPTGGLPFFHWICQPYFRPGPKEGNRENGAARSKRALEEEEGSVDVLSKNKQKKQLRNPHKTFDPSLKPKYAKCGQCGNPKVSQSSCPGQSAAPGGSPWAPRPALGQPRESWGGPGPGAAPVVRCAGLLAFLCPGQQVRVQPVPGLLQEASVPGDCGLPR